MKFSRITAKLKERATYFRETRRSYRDWMVRQISARDRILFAHPSLYPRGVASCFSLTKYFQPSRWIRHSDTASVAALNRLIGAGFQGEGDKVKWVCGEYEIGLPGLFAGETRVVENDFREIFLENHYARHLPFGRLVEDGDVVLDGGANIGAFAIYAASHGPNVKVYAFEPEPRIFACLQRNVRENGLDQQITCLPYGLSDTEQYLPIETNDQCFTATRFSKEETIQPGAGQQGTRLVTIDSVVQELKLTAVDVVKMDIEGFERYALRGAVQTMRTHRPKLTIAAYHLPSDPFVLANIVAEACPQHEILISEEAHLFAYQRNRDSRSKKPLEKFACVG